MRVSYNWLREFVPLEVSPERVADYLTMSGSEVESIEKPSSRVERALVVKVIENLDGGKIKVFDGKDELILESKFPLEAGVLYAFSRSGRFVSESELGIGESQGPLRIEKQVKIGTPLSELLGWDDMIFELEITPNRPDCLSQFGIARELSALLGLPLNFPEFTLNETEEKIEDRLSVRVEDFSACPRYGCRYIRDVKIGKSPIEMRARLAVLGVRPINNAVDVTNYVMLELGHPLHAFDRALLGSCEIIVRLSREGEKIRALDGKEYTLKDGIILITTPNEPVAIGGIMGGENSGVRETTSEIVLESAYFNPRFIRRASKLLELTTDSSIRFERGCDPNAVQRACDRAAYLISLVTGGKVLQGMIDIKQGEFRPRFIRLNREKIRRVLGLRVDPTRANKYLESLGARRVSGNERASVYEIPTYRPDITREIDLVEEIGRLNGYGRIRPSFRLSGQAMKRRPTNYNISRSIARILADIGFYEVVTNPFGSSRDFKPFREPDFLVNVINPISSDLMYLRPSLLPCLIKVLSHNHRHKQLDCRLFEIGRSYNYRAADHIEPETLALVLSGLRYPFSWGHQRIELDIFDLKGIIEYLFSSLGICDYTIEEKEEVAGYLCRGESFVVKRQGKSGCAGRLVDELLDWYDLKCKAYVAELPMEFFLSTKTPTFKQFERLPRVRRDIAIVVDEQIPASTIAEAIRSVSNLIVEITLFDVYTGKQIPQGKRSLAFALQYQAQGRTLTDEEVNGEQAKVIELLQRRFQATLRGI